MPDSLNTVEPAVSLRDAKADDVPESIRRRYLTERAGADTTAYFVDALANAPAFRDQGRRLSADRNDPNVVRDLVSIAVHRGWTEIAVRGQTDFRRAVWMAARQAGLEVRGYRPTDRDNQLLARRTEPAMRRTPATARPDTLRVVEAVVRNRVVEPAEQSRILGAARARLSHWLEVRARAPDARRDARQR